MSDKRSVKKCTLDIDILHVLLLLLKFIISYI